jgi:hypothetical protein
LGPKRKAAYAFSLALMTQTEVTVSPRNAID